MKIKVDLSVKFRAAFITFAQWQKSFLFTLPGLPSASVFAADTEGGKEVPVLEKPTVLLDRNGVKLSVSVVKS